jgi:hypothetical protein
VSQWELNTKGVLGIQLSKQTAGPLAAWSHGDSCLLCTDVETSETVKSMGGPFLLALTSTRLFTRLVTHVISICVALVFNQCPFTAELHCGGPELCTMCYSCPYKYNLVHTLHMCDACYAFSKHRCMCACLRYWNK